MSADPDHSPEPARCDDPTLTIQRPGAALGVSIGPYHLVRQLGEGGMGTVYHAFQSEPIRRDVALKIIKQGMDTRQVIARFESERQALAMMDHPNIARVFDAGASTAGLPYFVMELVDGVPITRYCDAKRLTLRQRIELYIPVCRAIQHAHQKGIIHRDIKPSNVLVTEQDGKPVPKVIDFGLAKALGHQLSEATMMTNLGTLVGTLEYMSPEQAELGRQDIDTRSDIYSLGVVLYELLTGTTPLEHGRLAKAVYLEVLQRIREEEPAPPSARMRQSASGPATAAQRRSDPAQLPRLAQGELDWMTMKALEKDRTRRYETVNGLVRDLERYLDGEPVEAAPPSAMYRLGKLVRKHRAWLVTAAAFAALLVAGVVVSSVMAVRASRAEREARAVNDFLQNDLLAQASANKQAGPGTKPDPDLKVRTALDRAADRIAGKFDRQPEVEASIRGTIGQTYIDLGLFTEASRQLERALELHRRVLGPENPKTLDTMSRLGMAATRRAKYPEAEALLSQALKIQRRVLGPEHLDTLKSMNILAIAYLDQAKYAQAETLLGQALEIRRRVLGSEHFDTLSSMNNLGGVYIEQGKYAQAEALHTQTLEIGRRVLGSEHPHTLLSMANVAFVYTYEGKYAQAEALNTQALEIRRRVLGPEHPETLMSMNNLAWSQSLQGKYALAQPLYMQVLETRRRVLGPEHPHTLFTLSAVASMHQRQGKYDLAEDYAAKALEGRRHTLGPDNPDTMAAAADLALANQSQGKFAASEPLAREALAADIKKRPDDWQRFRAESLLGASLAGQKKYGEAEPLLLEGYSGMVARKERMPVPDQYHLDRAGAWIALLYQSWGRPEKTAEWREKLQVTGPVTRAQ